jgi:hypothetical protein
MKRNLTPDEADRICRLLRDEFDNCPPRDAIAQWQSDTIELTRSMFSLTGLECFLECAMQMQVDYEFDYPSESEDDLNWQENASPDELNRNINPNRL